MWRSSCERRLPDFHRVLTLETPLQLHFEYIDTWGYSARYYSVSYPLLLLFCKGFFGVIILSPEVRHRLNRFHCVAYPPDWPLWRERNLAVAATFATFACTFNGTMVVVVHQTIVFCSRSGFDRRSISEVYREQILHLIVELRIGFLLYPIVGDGCDLGVDSLRSGTTLVDVPIVWVKVPQGRHLLRRQLQPIVPTPCRPLLVLSHLINHETQRGDDHGGRGRGVQAVADAIPRTGVSVDVAPSGSDGSWLRVSLGGRQR